MTASVLILLWVQNETISINRKKRKMFTAYTRSERMDWVWETTPLLLADAIKKKCRELKNNKLYPNNWPVFKSSNLFYEKECAYVDNDWFNFFPIILTEGNATSFNKNPFSINFTASEAKKYFGNKQAVGK